jgi:hypothetical protein
MQFNASLPIDESKHELIHIDELLPTELPNVACLVSDQNMRRTRVTATQGLFYRCNGDHQTETGTLKYANQLFGENVQKFNFFKQIYILWTQNLNGRMKFKKLSVHILWTTFYPVFFFNAFLGPHFVD